MREENEKFWYTKEQIELHDKKVREQALRKQREKLYSWDEVQSMMYSTPVIIDDDLINDIYWESGLLE